MSALWTAIETHLIIGSPRAVFAALTLECPPDGVYDDDDETVERQTTEKAWTPPFTGGRVRLSYGHNFVRTYAHTSGVAMACIFSPHIL